MELCSNPVNTASAAAASVVNDNKQTLVLVVQRCLDENNDGFIERQRFLDFCGDLSVSTDELQHVFDALDGDGDGKINVSDFTNSFDQITEMLGKQSTENLAVCSAQDRSMYECHVNGLESPMQSIIAGQQYISELYYNLTNSNQPDLVDLFEKHLASVVKDIKSRASENQRLEEALKRATKQHARQVNNLDREMESQMEKLEAKVREEEKLLFDKKLSDLQWQLDNKDNEMSTMTKTIDTLHERLNKETSKPSRKDEIDNICQENRLLKSQVTDSQTALALLRSELAELRSECVEQSELLQKAQRRSEDSLAEQENLSRQVQLLHEANQRLHDINDELRGALEAKKSECSPVRNTTAVDVMKLSAVMADPSCDLSSSIRSTKSHGARSLTPTSPRHLSHETGESSFNHHINDNSLFSEIHRASTDDDTRQCTTTTTDCRTYQTTNVIQANNVLQTIQDETKQTTTTNINLTKILASLLQSQKLTSASDQKHSYQKLGFGQERDTNIENKRTRMITKTNCKTSARNIENTVETDITYRKGLTYTPLNFELNNECAKTKKSNCRTLSMVDSGSDIKTCNKISVFPRISDSCIPADGARIINCSNISNYCPSYDKFEDELNVDCLTKYVHSTPQQSFDLTTVSNLKTTEPYKSDLEEDEAYGTMANEKNNNVHKQIQILEDTNKRLSSSNDELRVALKLIARSGSLGKPRKMSTSRRSKSFTGSDYGSLSSRSSRSQSLKQKRSSGEVGEATDESTTYDSKDDEIVQRIEEGTSVESKEKNGSCFENIVGVINPGHVTGGVVETNKCNVETKYEKNIEESTNNEHKHDDISTKTHPTDNNHEKSNKISEDGDTIKTHDTASMIDFPSEKTQSVIKTEVLEEDVVLNAENIKESDEQMNQSLTEMSLSTRKETQHCSSVQELNEIPTLESPEPNDISTLKNNDPFGNKSTELSLSQETQGDECHDESRSSTNSPHLDIEIISSNILPLSGTNTSNDDGENYGITSSEHVNENSFSHKSRVKKVILGTNTRDFDSTPLSDTSTDLYHNIPYYTKNIHPTTPYSHGVQTETKTTVSDSTTNLDRRPETRLSSNHDTDHYSQNEQNSEVVDEFTADSFIFDRRKRMRTRSPSLELFYAQKLHNFPAAAISDQRSPTAHTGLWHLTRRLNDHSQRFLQSQSSVEQNNEYSDEDSDDEFSDTSSSSQTSDSATMNPETVGASGVGRYSEVKKSKSIDDGEDDDEDDEDLNSEDLAKLVAFASDITDNTASDSDSTDNETKYNTRSNSRGSKECEDTSTMTNDSLSQSSTPERMYKLVLAGDAAVGKSSFILRLCRNKFHSNLNATLGVDFQVKNIEVDSKTVALQLWDTAGQERFRSIAKSYFRKVDAVLLLYDVTNESSFVNIRDWMRTIEESSNRKVPIMLCANKCDLRDEFKEDGRFVISTENGEKLAESYGAMFIETSAKDGKHIADACKELARVLATLENEEIRHHGLKLDKQNREKKKKCCNS